MIGLNKSSFFIRYCYRIDIANLVNSISYRFEILILTHHYSGVNLESFVPRLQLQTNMWFLLHFNHYLRVSTVSVAFDTERMPRLRHLLVPCAFDFSKMALLRMSPLF